MALQIKKCCNKPSPGWPLEGFEVRRGQIGGYDLLYWAGHLLMVNTFFNMQRSTGKNSTQIMFTFLLSNK